MDSTIESYVITEKQKDSRSWTPTPYLNASPALIQEGTGRNDWLISVVLDAHEYDEIRAWLEVNAERHNVGKGNLYQRWRPNIYYEENKAISFGNDVFMVLVNHTSEPGDTPPNTPLLYERTTQSDIDEWIQPTTPEERYDRYAIVSHNGAVWESDKNNNDDEPGVKNWSEM